MTTLPTISLALAAIACLGSTLRAGEATRSTAPSAATQSAQSPAPLPVRAAEVWGANYFPNCELTTHEGKRVKYFDDLLAGKTVIVNFIYTSCPDACPMATAKLAEVQELLKHRMGKDLFFYSISVDPDMDTPELLAQYAKRFNAGPGWLFLTGKKSDIRDVRKKMGMLRADEENKEQHTLDMLIGNQASGVWVKRSTMDNPYAIASQIEGKALGWKSGRTVEAETIAPQVRKYEAGEDIFRTRCATCHAIGKDDGLPQQGPNLLGVVDRRDRKWLERWILEPDVMLALKDPLAMDLYNAWHQLPMPNMRLTPLEVQNVIGYMDRTSDAYVEELKAKEAQAAADWAATDTGDHGEEPADDELLAPLGATSKKAGCCQKTDGLVGDDVPAVVAAEAAPAPVVAAPIVEEPAPAKAGCCKADDGLVGDDAAESAEAATVSGEARVDEEATDVPPCCREDELVVDAEAAAPGRDEPKPRRDKLPYPAVATGVLGLACVGLLGLLRLGRGAP
ncbi:MAG: hypothetical protein RL112_578 [Planctomycetota bacterium]